MPTSNSSQEDRQAIVVNTPRYPGDGIAGELTCRRGYLHRTDTNSSFFGSAAALLDRSGVAIANRYAYRMADGCDNLALAAPSYGIREQD